jgi:NTE family protein
MALFRRRKPLPPEPAPPSEPPPPVQAGPRPISLALQGGGSHGAFEWGVIDALLEDGRVRIEAVSAASAGAMNAAVLAAGLAEDGPRGARAGLDRFWRAVNQAGGRNVFGDSALWTAAFNPRWLQANPFYRHFETLMLSASPYEFNPFNLNPLREVLNETVDFEAVRRAPLQLFVAATDVLEGKGRIFAREELTAEVLLASSALPHLFQGVEIDRRLYWDGGYAANPPLWPLIYSGAPADVVLVMLNPFRRAQAPRTAGEIVDRLNEITFNSAVSAELRAIAFVQKLLDEGLLVEEARSRYRRMYIHAVEADGRLDDLPMSSKFDTEWNFLLDLKARGRAAAEAWLATHFEALGTRSSVDLQAQFL